MEKLSEVTPGFVEMAHAIVSCSASTVDSKGRPRSRILHPYWEWDGSRLVGWVATAPTRTKIAHLEHGPFMSLNFRTMSQDTCVAEVEATWHIDLATRERVWRTYVELPAPVGYDPAIIPPMGRPRLTQVCGPPPRSLDALGCSWKLDLGTGRRCGLIEGRQLTVADSDAGERRRLPI